MGVITPYFGAKAALTLLAAKYTIERPYQ